MLSWSRELDQMKISMVEKWWNKYNEYLVGIIYHHWKQSWPTHVVRSQTSWTLYWDLPTSSTRDQFANRQRTQDLEMLCRQHLPFTSPWRQKAPVLLWHHSYKKTWWTLNNQLILEANTHWPTPTIWFTPSAISKAQCCQVPLWVCKTSCNKTLHHL